MKHLILILFLCFLTAQSQTQQLQLVVVDSTESDTTWYNALNLTIEGKGWKNTKSPYDRLPDTAESIVTPKVWELSQNSTGINIRFITDATSFKVKWELIKLFSMNHMASTGVSGIDVYYKKDDGKWFYLATGRPGATLYNASNFKSPSKEKKNIEYMINLPLYNGVSKVEIGILKEFKIEKASLKKSKPIVIYGTSIAQGGCASRPGLNYTSIISRDLNYEVINLGFSGSARMEFELSELLNQLDASMIIIDPLHNVNDSLVNLRAEKFIQNILNKNKSIPIVMVEDTYITNEFPSPKGKLFYKIYLKLKKAGNKNLYFFKAKDMLGYDGEGTVDTVHPNDLGFWRMAQVHIKEIKKILKK